MRQGGTSQIFFPHFASLLTRLSLAPLVLELKGCGKVRGIEKATPMKSDVYVNFLWVSWKKLTRDAPCAIPVALKRSGYSHL